MPHHFTTCRIALGCFALFLPSIASAQNGNDIIRAIPTPGVTPPQPEIPEPGSPEDIRQTRRDKDLPELYVVEQASAPEPIPALKYRLYPSRGELKPGNSVPLYYRALVSLKDRSSAEHRREFYDLMELLDDRPFSEYDDPEVREQADVLRGFESALQELERAVYREQTDWDWQMTQLEGTDPITFRLPEVQEAREFSRILSVKSRLAAAEGNIDEALRLNRINFKLAEMIAEPPTLINDLVGVAMSAISLAALRDTIVQTDCPNLYWALAALPDPLISMNPGLEYESAMPEMMFPFLKNPAQSEHSAAEWARLMRQMVHNLDDVSGQFRGSATGQDLLGAGMLVRSYPVAKRELAAQGWDRDELDQMPVGQVVAIYQKHVTRSIYDEFMKWSYTSYQERQQSSRFQTDQKRFQQEQNRMREPFPIATLLLPAVKQAKEAEVRMTAKIKGLMVLEAIRMHMAENDGQLPKTLDEITVVPAPKESPLTGQPFEYQKTEFGYALIVPTMPETFGRKYWWEFQLKNAGQN
ncbi:MAG: hypothetical protein HUJ26_06955 [Planctomycetaceae bacterium]|nr:hypothetical protein [Planctomycetaceae bacterium]